MPPPARESRVGAPKKSADPAPGSRPSSTARTSSAPEGNDVERAVEAAWEAHRKLAEMKEILDGAGSRPEVHLAVSATTKTRDLEDIFQQYEPFGYTRVIVTKLDETSQIGSILSVVAKRNKPISFFTDGQKVPQDIEPATVVRLMLNMEGFHINRDHLESRFGAAARVKAR